MQKPFSLIGKKLRDWQQLLRRWWDETEAPPSIFHSARLKLTVFYLAVLLAMSLTLTLSIRMLAAHEFSNADTSARGVVRRLLLNEYSVPPLPPDTFNRYQSDQDDMVRRHLNEDVIIINLAALVLGVWLSYWYAGRTLRPIEEAHQAQARFASDASHELRTPLANLKVENEVFLRQKDFSKAEARELITSNLEEVQRLESLASNLLALTQYERAALKLSAIDVQAVAEAAVQQVEKLATSKHVTIEHTVQPGQITGHATSLTQLLGIVLENALKYGPEKGTVYLDGQRQGNEYVLSVRDEGPGIAAADLPHIFERLYRGDKARSSKVGGYGLGLSLAQEIADANHATIEAANHRGGGAVFMLTFSAA